MKASQIEDYFQQITDNIITFSEDRMIIEAMKLFTESFNIIDNETDYSDEDYASIVKENKQYYKTVFKSKLIQNRAAGNDSFNEKDYWEGNTKTVILQNLYITSNPHTTGAKHLLSDAGDGSSYSKTHKIYHPIFRNYLEKFGYDDIFLVDHKTGHILYSVFKEVDFATNLINGPYSKTNSAKAFLISKEAKDKEFVKLVDFELYMPSYYAPAAFISSPIKEGDKTIGVLIFQIPIDRINNIMTNKKSWSKVGLGKSGETYLVGQDSLLRNQSRFLIEDKENYLKMIKNLGLPQETRDRISNLNSSIGLQPVITIGTKAALHGETGTQIFPDYRGVSVLSSYKPLNIPGVNWILMSEMDENEAFANVYKLRRDILIWVFGLIIVIVIIAFFFSKTITRPIEILRKESAELAMGNLDLEIHVDTEDEIGQLAANFETIRSSIKSLVGELEEMNQGLEVKVEERTVEINDQKKLLESTLESLTHPFYVVDANDYTLTLANSAAKKLSKSGLSTCYALTHQKDKPCDSKEDPCPLKIVRETKKSVIVEHTHYDKDGKPKFAEVHGYPIFDENGNVVQMIEYSLDITERKMIEEQLRNRSAALKAAANGIVIVDPDGIVRWANPAFSRLTGYSYEEVVGQNTRILNSGKHDVLFYKNMWNTINSGEVWHSEVINKKKDGTLYSEEMTITPIFNDKNEIVNFVAIKQDITRRKELEERLNKSEERLNFALEGSSDGLFDWRIHDDYIYYSPRFETMLGFEPGELEQNWKSWEKLIHPENWQAVEEALNAHFNGKKSSFEAEYRIKSKSGEWVWVLGRGRVVKRDDKGAPLRIVGTHVDVTERKDLEQQLEAANKRMKGELDIGKEIQMSMLPLVFPAFPNHTEFAVYAKLIPAREVGGDFYDFFFIDEDRFCLVIGDVSGKGVPAALFMAVTKTLIKSRSSNDYSTANIITHVNDEMSKDNKASMFITVFTCIVNINTGEMVYTNAGHNPPYIKRMNGKLDRLDKLHGPVVGAMDGLTYKESVTTLSPGESLLLYTDGVTEAMDIGNNLFSEERLVKYYSTGNSESVENTVNMVVDEVKKYEGEADQADDITVLAFKYIGNYEEESSMIFDITIKNGLPGIEHVKERFDSFADENKIETSIRRKMYLVFDEFLNNIISYAYNDKKEHDIDINVKLVNSQLMVTITDDGIPFNPLSAKTPDTDLSIDEREIGGLGIHLVRKLMDKVSYQRKDNKNIVNLIKVLNS